MYSIVSVGYYKLHTSRVDQVYVANFIHETAIERMVFGFEFVRIELLRRSRVHTICAKAEPTTEATTQASTTKAKRNGAVVFWALFIGDMKQ